MATIMGIEQGQIQSTIEAASADKQLALEIEAEDRARECGRAIRLGTNSRALKDQFHLAIEMLVRLEATRQQKGWWFRAKRRVELTKKYTASPY